MSRVAALAVAAAAVCSLQMVGTGTSPSSAHVKAKPTSGSHNGVDGSRITVRNLTGKDIDVASSFEDYRWGRTCTLPTGGGKVHIDEGCNKGPGILAIDGTWGAEMSASWSDSEVDTCLVLGNGRFLSAHNPWYGKSEVVGAQLRETKKEPENGVNATHFAHYSGGKSEDCKVTDDFTYKVTYRNCHDDFHCWDIDITTLN